MSVTLEDILRIDFLEARNLGAVVGKKFSGVSTDTRSIKQGELFVALRGEAFDANAFIAEAFRRGARCVIAEESVDLAAVRSRPVVIVRDGARALGELAALYRRRFSLPVLAVAGSNGKTTTKEMIAAVLGTNMRVLKTEGNLNNHIGVPQTILRLRPEHEIAVIEIGTNHFGELSYLCGILKPTHGVLTNIGREHLEFFGSLSGVARAEGELFEALRTGGVGFVNADDRHVAALGRNLRRKLRYGFRSSQADVRGRFLKMRENGCAEFTVERKKGRAFTIRLAVPGRHAMENGLAAAAVGLAFDVPPARVRHALETFRAVGKRMEIVSARGVTILNDTYNANPDSVASALETMASVQARGKKIVVLGDMLELGASARREHERVGRSLTARRADMLFAFGPLSKHLVRASGVRAKRHYSDKQKLCRDLLEAVESGDVVLIKGSRGMKMEDVVMTLRQRKAA